MKTRAVVVTVVGTLLGILCAALGFAAEAKRVKDVKIDPRTFDCINSRSPAGILALATAGVLVLAQIIIHSFAGCICCIHNRGRRTGIITLIVFIFTWISFGFAIFFLLGVASVYHERSVSSRQNVGHCFVVSRGLAAIATALAVISVLLGIVYYHMVERVKKEMTIQGGQYRQEIPIVQPHLPAEPCLAHEDTYNRRQMP